MQAAQQLWQIVHQAGLAAHLQALRGYFLLGHGDFYHAFLARVGDNLHGLHPEMASLALVCCSLAHRRSFGACVSLRAQQGMPCSPNSKCSPAFHRVVLQRASS